MFTPDYINCSNPNSDGYSYCEGNVDNSGNGTDYWAGARRACTEAGGSLPNSDELAAIATEIYGRTITKNQNAYSGITFTSKYGITSGWYLWSSMDCTGDCAFARYFGKFTEYINTGRGFGRGTKAVCVVAQSE